ncbi:MAG TPA: neutral zinc metallopeptidase [Gaiellaceae bacterium]|jgi:predicted metalloprotease|nr:neutral zinc metallopeptidase [Gaiellaceae bacterium]
MRFRRNAELDPGQVTDVRGRRMSGPGGLAVGGGGIGVAALVIYLLIALLGGGEGLGQLAPLDEQRIGQGDTPSEVSQECRTGQDANEREDCRIVAVVNSVQRFWNDVFQRSGRQYPYSDTVFFTDQIQTGCGVATSQVGPFYCPRDQLVYIDLGFFDEIQSRFGAGAAPFAQAYVLAHEYGHHVQDLLGVLGRIGNDTQGPESRAVRTELQADCYAGVWAAHAVETGQIEELTQEDINSAVDTAAAIGDDRIQAQTQGQVSPESWTHGSSEQRRRWFSRGYEQGKPAACDTFSGGI